MGIDGTDWKTILEAGRLPIFLVRHGQTDWNLERRFLGRSDIPLNELGRSQAQATARALVEIPFSSVLASPLSRASGTADILAHGRDVAVAHHEGLMELDQGELEGHQSTVLAERYPDFFAAWQKDPTDVRVPGGETLRECQNRGMQSLEELAAGAAPDRPLAIVSHQMVIASFVCGLLELPLRHFRLIRQSNCAINLLSFDSDFRLHRINECAHVSIE